MGGRYVNRVGRWIAFYPEVVVDVTQDVIFGYVSIRDCNLIWLQIDGSNS